MVWLAYWDKKAARSL